jgi:hypothetical protein
MKSFVLIIFLAAVSVTAQQVTYEVVPDTKGNEIDLSISNKSNAANTGLLKISLAKIPRGIDLCNTRYEIKDLKAGEEKEVIFTFDAKRIPGAAKDTISFLITDNNGGSWKKEIYLTYALPKEFKLEQNYPNPFNPSTTIEFTIPKEGRYSVSVYNILGQLVKTLTEDEFKPGYYKVNFDASRISSGVYIYRLYGNSVNITKKMILMK